MDKPLKIKTHKKKQIGENVAFQVVEILPVFIKSSSISIEGDENLVFKKEGSPWLPVCFSETAFSFIVSFCEWAMLHS